VKLAWSIAYVGEMRNACTILDGKPEDKKHLEDIVIDGRILLQWFLRKWGMRAGKHSHRW
jgi:hypothetical protein